MTGATSLLATRCPLAPESTRVDGILCRPIVTPHSTRDGFHDLLGPPLDGEEIRRRGRVGVPPSLLPIFQRGKRNAIGRREAVLRHAKRTADRFHVRYLHPCHAHAAHLAPAGVRRRLPHAFDQLVCKLAHFH